MYLFILLLRVSGRLPETTKKVTIEIFYIWFEFVWHTGLSQSCFVQPKCEKVCWRVGGAVSLPASPPPLLLSTPYTPNTHTVLVILLIFTVEDLEHKGQENQRH